MGKQIWKAGNMLYPLPAVMVSCKTLEACKQEEENWLKEKGLDPALAGRPNIITIAWAGTICSDPAMLSISVRPNRFSHHIIEQSGEFVVNLVTEELTRVTDLCGVKSGKDMDKFKECGLTPFSIPDVEAPGIAESPVSIACKVKEQIPLGSHDLFLAEVLHVAVEDSYMDDKGKFHLNDSGLVTYSHGEYFTLGDYVGKFGYSVKKK